MTGNATWDTIVFIVTVFCGGVSVTWTFWSQITGKLEKLASTFEERLDSVANKIVSATEKLEKRITEVDVAARTDRGMISRKLDEFDARDRLEHEAMREQITEIRVAVGQLETRKDVEKRVKSAGSKSGRK